MIFEVEILEPFGDRRYLQVREDSKEALDEYLKMKFPNQNYTILRQVIKSFSADNGYAFLSNFYETPVTFEGITYPSAEHAFQAAKTTDASQKMAIANASTPGRAKRMGKTVNLRSDWESIKKDVMYRILWCKFTQNLDLKEKLLATKDALLIEGNVWHDNYWGDCYCDKCISTSGLNTLGVLLMIVRKKIKEGKDIWSGG